MFSKFPVLLRLTLSLSILPGLIGCEPSSTTTTMSDSSNNILSDTSMEKTSKILPAGAAPSWAPDIKPEMQAVIEKLQSYDARPIETLTAAEARKNPTPTTAVVDLMKEHNIPMPLSSIDTAGMEITVNGSSIHARIYSPKGSGPFPVIVYYHGGGWVIADLDTYDASAKGLAEQTGAVVISVHYRQAPEYKFPTAHNDAFAAYQWALQHMADIKGDSTRIAVAGESAGGNLACNVSIMARDKHLKMPVHQLLVYPIANDDMNAASYQKNDSAKPLNKPMMQWFAKNYLPDMTMMSDPRIALVKANLKGLPPTTLITASIDPLQTEGMMLSDKLKAAGVNVNYKNYEGVTHEFFGMAAVVPQAKDAQMLAANDLKNAFRKQ
jgi:acetyl esterase/lipase